VGSACSMESWGVDPTDWDSGTDFGSDWGAETDYVIAAFQDAAEVPMAWVSESECCC
jgi:hypothetical protein